MCTYTQITFPHEETEPDLKQSSVVATLWGLQNMHTNCIVPEKWKLKSEILKGFGAPL